VSPSLFTNFGADATKVVSKISESRVFSLSCHNINAASRYLQLHDTVTALAGTEVPLVSFLVPAGATVIIGTDWFSNEGLRFSVGITFAFSTTEGTYTAGTNTDQFTQIRYSS
jgi:hypothetical protein